MRNSLPRSSFACPRPQTSAAVQGTDIPGLLPGACLKKFVSGNPGRWSHPVRLWKEGPAGCLPGTNFHPAVASIPLEPYCRLLPVRHSFLIGSPAREGERLSAVLAPSGLRKECLSKIRYAWPVACQGAPVDPALRTACAVLPTRLARAPRTTLYKALTDCVFLPYRRWFLLGLYLFPRQGTLKWCAPHGGRREKE